MTSINKKVLLWGLIVAGIIGISELLLYTFCTDDILCFGLLIIPLLPSTLLGFEGTLSIIISLIFWFLIGSLIGFLIYKLKNK